MAEVLSQPVRSKSHVVHWWALGLSILLHLVLATLLGWLPMLHTVNVRERQQERPEDSVLQFAFADVPEEPAAEPAPAPGEVPFQSPAPRPSADLSPPPPDPGLQPEPVPPGESEPEHGGVEPSEEPARSEPESTPQSGLEHLPLDPDAPNRRGTNAAKGENTKQGFDLSGAIRDFGRVLDQARSSSAPQQTGSGPPRNVFVPNGADLPTTGFGVGNLTFETRDFDWEDYARSIYWEIWRAWHNRLLRLASDFERWSYDNQEPDLYHQVQIRFVIEGTGEVTGIVVEVPSGCIPLDDSATQALAEVILPALPDAFPKEREVVHARFVAQGEIRALRPHLERLKALNYF